MLVDLSVVSYDEKPNQLELSNIVLGFQSVAVASHEN